MIDFVARTPKISDINKFPTSLNTSFAAVHKKLPICSKKILQNGLAAEH